MPILEIKIYIYQLFRSLAYIHSMGICHRDIKPQNLLLDPSTGVLKLCDFGSAKILVESEPNVSYICSRYYRAPELIFGATNYTTKIGKQSSKLTSARHVLIVDRCLVHWLCNGRVDARTALVPWRVWNRPAGGDYQGPWDPHPRTDSHDESQLYGTQVPSDQAPSLQQGKVTPVICKALF